VTNSVTEASAPSDTTISTTTTTTTDGVTTTTTTKLQNDCQVTECPFQGGNFFGGIVLGIVIVLLSLFAVWYKYRR
jgi:hypothetical protein